MSQAIVVDAALADRLSSAGREALLVVPRGRAPGRPWRRSSWRAVDADVAFAILREAPPTALVLARRRDVDPGAAVLRPLARLVGLTVLVLPEPVDAAIWAASLACVWASSGQDRLEEAVSVAAGLTRPAGPLPRAPWGAAGLLLPALRPRVIGRWATLAWRACDACRDGGGLSGASCAACGAPVPGRSRFEGPMRRTSPVSPVACPRAVR